MSREEEWSFHELVDPNHVALVVVDMQNDYCSSKGGCAKLGFDMSSVQRIAAPLARFIAESRSLGIRIVHTRSWHSDWTDSPVRRKKQAKTYPYLARAGSWGADWFEDHKEFQPLPSEYVISKHRYNAMLDTDLDFILRSVGIRTLVFTGTNTNVCVESTARDSYMKNYHVVVVKDLVATPDDITLQEATLKNIELHFGYLTTSLELLAVWETLKVQAKSR